MERLENTLAVSKYLATHFNANIYLWEVSSYHNGVLENLLPGKVKYFFCQDDDPILHRTRYINRMVSSSTDSYIAIWDVDVIVSVPQVICALQLLCEGADLVYPYKECFYDTSAELRKIFFETGNVNMLMEQRAFMNELYTPNPVGGVFLANRKSFEKVGMENEGFYGWGIEDGERFCRWDAQKRKIQRVEGPLFHLTHSRGSNSLITNNDEYIMKKRILLNSIRKTKWKDE